MSRALEAQHQRSAHPEGVDQDAAPTECWRRGTKLRVVLYHVRRMSHSFCNNFVHLVYSTKDREELIPESLEPRIYSYIAEIARFLSEQGIDFKWQKGYAPFSVSPSSVKNVKAYIRNQKEHHKRRSFEDEFVDMLKKAGVDYDPRYVFA